MFASYKNDISSAQRREIEGFIEELRSQLNRVLAKQSLDPGDPQICASHSIEVGLTFIEVAIEELAPRYMRGYGAISEEGAADLNEIVETLLKSTRVFHGYVRELAHHSD